jgi:hypothetical protein
VSKSFRPMSKSQRLDLRPHPCGRSNYFFRATKKYHLVMDRIIGHGPVIARRRRSCGRELGPIIAIPTPGIGEGRVGAVPPTVQQQVSTVEGEGRAYSCCR